MALTVLAAAVFTLAGGRLSDVRDSRIPTLLAFLGVSFAGFILFAIAGTLSTLVLACLLIGAGQGGANGPLIALLADLTPTERTGRAMVTNKVFGDLGGGLGPVVTLPPCSTSSASRRSTWPVRGYRSSVASSCSGASVRKPMR
jgi:MFS family permease